MCICLQACHRALPKRLKAKPSPVATDKAQIRERLNCSYFWVDIKIAQDCFSLPPQAHGSGKKGAARSHRLWPGYPLGQRVVFQRHPGTSIAGVGQQLNLAEFFLPGDVCVSCKADRLLQLETAGVERWAVLIQGRTCMKCRIRMEELIF